jgi:hypothetical protein
VARFVAALLGLVLSLVLPNFIGSGTTRTNGIINNLRNLRGAMEQWALDHGRTGDAPVTREDLVSYLRRRLHAVAGERYSVKSLAAPVQAVLTRKLEGRPPGTMFLFEPNGRVRIILPTDVREH